MFCVIVFCIYFGGSLLGFVCFFSIYIMFVILNMDEFGVDFWKLEGVIVIVCKMKVVCLLGCYWYE